MGFWKELGVTALEKGKNLLRGGKQAVGEQNMLKA